MIYNLDILNFKSDKLALEKSGANFTVVETGYTARIKQIVGDKKHTYLYTETKKNIKPSILRKYNQFTLKNINRIRSLAKKYPLETVTVYDDLGWAALFANLPSELNLYCIDIKSAYLNSAVNIGLLDKKFVDSFEKEFNNEVGYEGLFKPSRLVVLGSLATKRRTRIYNQGICIDDSGFVVYDNHTRNVYVKVCSEVDKLMLELNEIAGTVGYYWDCVFCTSEKSKNEVEKAIKEKGFDFKTDKRPSRIYYYPNGGGCVVTNPENEIIKKVYQFNYRKVFNHEKKDK
jgi:hypothetical protein